MKASESYNKIGYYFFLATMLFNTLWVLYFMLIQNSIDLGELEKSKTSEDIASGADEQEQLTPWVSTESLIAQGSKIYKAQCALCHGASGLGDGTPGLIPPPRNLVEGKWTVGGSSKDLFVTVTNGIKGTSMAPFKHLPKADRWALVHYVRSITKNKIPDNEKELEEFAKTTL